MKTKHNVIQRRTAAPVVAVDWHDLIIVNTRPDVIALMGDLERCLAWFDR